MFRPDLQSEVASLTAEGPILGSGQRKNYYQPLSEFLISSLKNLSNVADR